MVRKGTARNLIQSSKPGGSTVVRFHENQFGWLRQYRSGKKRQRRRGEEDEDKVWRMKSVKNVNEH